MCPTHFFLLSSFFFLLSPPPSFFFPLSSPICYSPKCLRPTRSPEWNDRSSSPSEPRPNSSTPRPSSSTWTPSNTTSPPWPDSSRTAPPSSDRTSSRTGRPPSRTSSWQADGHVGGIAVSSIGQAEVFVPNGFSDVFVANLVVTPQKITRLCALARQARIGVAVDSPANVADLSEAAVANGVCLDVAVYVNTRLGLYGVEPGQPAIDLAEAVVDAPGLDFAGIMTQEGSILCDDSDDAATESRAAIQPLLDTRQDIESAGIPVRVVSAGNTSNYQVVGAIDGVTEDPCRCLRLARRPARAPSAPPRDRRPRHVDRHQQAPSPAT